MSKPIFVGALKGTSREYARQIALPIWQFSSKTKESFLGPVKKPALPPPPSPWNIHTTTKSTIIRKTNKGLKFVGFYGTDRFDSEESDPYITKTSLFKYTENFTTKKNENFQIKNSDIFHISACFRDETPWMWMLAYD